MGQFLAEGVTVRACEAVHVRDVNAFALEEIVRLLRVVEIRLLAVLALQPRSRCSRPGKPRTACAAWSP
jgi:hypothetical protein